MSIDEDRIISLKYEVAKLQRDYSHLLQQKKDCEENKYKLEQDIETVNDKLGNELQVKYLEIEGLKEEVRILMKGTEVLGITIEKQNSTLDEIKTFVNGSDDYACITDDNVLEAQKILKEILAKHEDKK